MSISDNYMPFFVTIYWFVLVCIVASTRYRSSRDEFERLKVRLWGYSQLKSKKRTVSAIYCNKDWLSRGEFEVLLGVLKKVEQKNSVLVTIWTFILMAIVTFYATSISVCDGTCSETGRAQIAIWAGMAVLPFLAVSLFGIKQLDNFSAPASDWKDGSVGNESYILGLQEALMHDALWKEDLFFISKTAALLFCLLSASGLLLMMTS